jgi:WD40 repeat protein
LREASEPQDDESESAEQDTSEESVLLEEPLLIGASEFISSYVISSELSQDQKMLSLMLLGNTLHTFDLSHGKRVHSLVLSDPSLSPLAISLDQDILAFKDWSNRVSLRETSGGEEIASLEGHTGKVRCLAFSSDGTLIATGGEDNIVFVWRMEDGEILNTLQHSEAPQAIAFSPEDSILVVRSRSNIYVWSLLDQQILQRYRGYSMTLSPDGNLLAIASSIQDNRTIEIHKTISGELISVIGAKAKSLAFSPDNSLLAVADTAVTLWQVTDGTLMRMLKGGGDFGEITFSPDGKLLLLTGWDGSLNGWGIP